MVTQGSPPASLLYTALQPVILHSVNCRVCRTETTLFDSAVVLGKYSAAYHLCPSCHFLQVADPHWLAEAYTSPINAKDLGYVDRNFAAAQVTKSCLKFHFPQASTFVDYGGGYGLFVRLMRDRGYDFHLSDKYCRNIFAHGFEAAPGQRYDFLTAFEVFEHLPDPVEGLKEMLKISDTIFFSTGLIPSPPSRIKDWWYYSPDHGQHVSFYSVDSLQFLARQFQLNFVTNGSNFHLLSPRKISSAYFKLTSRRKVAALVDMFARRPSLVLQDVETLSRAEHKA